MVFLLLNDVFPYFQFSHHTSIDLTPRLAFSKTNFDSDYRHYTIIQIVVASFCNHLHVVPPKFGAVVNSVLRVKCSKKYKITEY